MRPADIKKEKKKELERVISLLDSFGLKRTDDMEISVYQDQYVVTVVGERIPLPSYENEELLLTAISKLTHKKFLKQEEINPSIIGKQPRTFVGFEKLEDGICVRGQVVRKIGTLENIGDKDLTDDVFKHLSGRVVNEIDSYSRNVSEVTEEVKGYLKRIERKRLRDLIDIMHPPR